MKIDLLSKVIELKSKKKEFSIITDLQTAKNYVYDPDCKLDKDLEDFKTVSYTHLTLPTRLPV